MLKKLVIAVVLSGWAWAGSASATPIVFTTSGGDSVSGKATFNFSATSFTVTLENLTNPLGFTDQELDGLTFNLSSSGSPSLTSVSAVGVLDCSSDHVLPCAAYAGVVPSNDGWGVSTSAGLTDLTTMPLGFHPFAIIDSTYTLPSNGNGNLANPQHNPFLLGPVVFTFAGSFTGVSGVTFDWGTQPDTTTGICASGCVPTRDLTPVPEPASLLLLSTGIGYVVRRRRRP